jgi:hypothetical protein
VIANGDCGQGTHDMSAARRLKPELDHKLAAVERPKPAPPAFFAKVGGPPAVRSIE